MAGRDYMVRYREERMMSRELMARRCRVTARILRMLEEDENCVTAPSIVRRVAEGYRLTEEQRIGMLPENYRPGPNYNPDKYVEQDVDANWRSGLI